MLTRILVLSTLAVAAYAGFHGGYGGGYESYGGGHQSYGGGHGHQHEQHWAPQPYDFGYKIKDKHGSSQYRKETGNGHGGVTGSYGYMDPHGVYRHVEYIADKAGFRAKIKTNEPGTDNQDPASVHLQANPIQVHSYGGHGHGGHGGYDGGHHSGYSNQGGHGGFGGHESSYGWH